MLGTVTASIDLVNDVTQAPIDNTTMIMDLVGVGAGLFGGRGIENGTSESLKLTKYINTSNVQDFISKLTAKAKPAFAGFSEEQLAKESGTMVSARDEYRLYNKELSNGQQFTKVGRKTALKKNINYESNGYHYSTDDLSRIEIAKRNLQTTKAKRNPYAQRIVGGADRLSTDDGGHLIASMFGGSGNLDNLVAQSRNINRAGGEWYNLEKEWAEALKEQKNVHVEIHIQYDGTSLRPSNFDVKYIINNKTKITQITN